MKQTQNFTVLVRENRLYARKATPTRLTFGIGLIKNIVPITYETYLNARASRDEGRGDTKFFEKSQEKLKMFKEFEIFLWKKDVFDSGGIRPPVFQLP